MEQENKERLLKAATGLFAEAGYDKVSIRQIADKAGANSAMISYYFGSKEKLYREVVMEQVRGLDHFLRPAIRKLAPEKILECYALTLQAIHAEHPAMAKFVSREIVQPSPSMKWFIREKLQAVYEILAEAIACGIAQGKFREDLEIRSTVILWAGMVNFYYLAYNIHSKLDEVSAGKIVDKDYIAQALRIFLAGIERR